MRLRINIGCGATPTRGWRNFDNSWSVRLSKIPLLPGLLQKMGIIEDSEQQFIRFARETDIEYGDGTNGLPIQDQSVDVIYTSHVLEHLDKNEAEKFLREAFRVLRPGGIIRIVVPDIRIQIAHYNECGDADAFIEATQLCVPRPRSLAQMLRLLLVGPRHHQWMYDGKSLSALLRKHGFINADVMPVGQTKIHDHEPLDLQERASESVCVEAEKPTTEKPSYV
jgi:predicted SAM-dependent methyltransferase